MKKMIFWMLLCIVGFTRAELAITNGDFETDAPVEGDLADIPEWYEPNPATFWVAPWCKSVTNVSHNDTGVLLLAGAPEAVSMEIDSAGDAGFCYQSIGTKGTATNLTLAFEWARPGDGDGEVDLGLTFTILESNGSFSPSDNNDILGQAGVTVIDQITTLETAMPVGLTRYEIWTFDLSIAGSGELFLRINNYETAADAWNAWISLDNIEIVTVDNESPEDNGADLAESEGEINVEPDNSSNDLIFTVYDARIATIDVQLAPYPDPNLVEEQYRIVEGVAVTPGQQYTVDLEAELSANLEYDTVYYWKVIGYDLSLNAIEGETTSFRTVPENPVIGKVVPPISAVDAGSSVVFGLSKQINIAEFQWYKVGEIDPLVDGDDYSGTTTDTLTVLDMQLADEGVFYCVGTNAVGSDTNEEDPGRAMIARLVSYYPMEEIVDIATPDTVDGLDLTLMSDSEAVVGLPILDSDVVDTELGTSSLSFSNPLENDPNGVYGQLPAGAVSYADMTISCWVKWNGTEGYERIFDFGNDDTQYMFLTPSNGSTIRFGIKDTVTEESTDVEQVLDSKQAIVLDEWTYIAVTLSGDTAKLYVNGELNSTNDNVDIDPIDFDSQLNYFGKSQFAADWYFTGKIDEVKIYNYALTTEEIAQDYMDVAGGWVCDYDRDALLYDHNGNCVIDIADFAIFVATWLDSHRIYDDEQ